MRSDMHKVVTERPRRNPGVKYRQIGRVNRHDCLKFAEMENYDGVKFRKSRKFASNSSMRRPYRYGYENSKEFSDLINPLIRYLHGRVGSQWDDVFSEICQTLPRDGMNADHIRQHVSDEVTINYMVVDGQIVDNRGWRVYGLYVDANGVLQKAPSWKAERNLREENWRTHYAKTPSGEFVRDPQTGVWYQIEKRVVEPAEEDWRKPKKICYLSQQREKHDKLWAEQHGYTYYPGFLYRNVGETYYVKIKQAGKQQIREIAGV